MTVRIIYKEHWPVDKDSKKNKTVAIMNKFQVTQDDFSTLKGAVNDNALDISHDFRFHIETSQVLLKHPHGRELNQRDIQLYVKEFQEELNKALEVL